jgi:hypothetical protein
MSPSKRIDCRECDQMTCCGSGFIYRVTPCTGGVLAPKTKVLERALRQIPDLRIVISGVGSLNAIFPVISFPAVVRILREHSGTRRTSHSLLTLMKGLSP